MAGAVAPISFAALGVPSSTWETVELAWEEGCRVVLSDDTRDLPTFGSFGTAGSWEFGSGQSMA
jgi:hypothetical protein